MSEFNPLVQRVDALLKRHQQQSAAGPDTTQVLEEQVALSVGAVAPDTAQPGNFPAVDDDIPVLTEIVEAARGATPAPLDAAAAADVEAAVLEKVLARLDVVLEQRLGRTVSDLLEQATDGLRADLSASMREIVREAVSAAVRDELASRPHRD